MSEIEIFKKQIKLLEKKIELLEKIISLQDVLKQNQQVVYPYISPVIIPNTITTNPGGHQS